MIPRAFVSFVIVSFLLGAVGTQGHPLVSTKSNDLDPNAIASHLELNKANVEWMIDIRRREAVRQTLWRWIKSEPRDQDEAAFLAVRPHYFAARSARMLGTLVASKSEADELLAQVEPERVTQLLRNAPSKVEEGVSAPRQEGGVARWEHTLLLSAFEGYLDAARRLGFTDTAVQSLLHSIQLPLNERTRAAVQATAHSIEAWGLPNDRLTKAVVTDLAVLVETLKKGGYKRPPDSDDSGEWSIFRDVLFYAWILSAVGDETAIPRIEEALGAVRAHKHRVEPRESALVNAEIQTIESNFQSRSFSSRHPTPTSVTETTAPDSSVSMIQGGGGIARDGGTTLNAKVTKGVAISCAVLVALIAFAWVLRRT